MLPITLTVNILLVFSYKFGQTSFLPEISNQTLCDLGFTVIIFNHSSIFAFALISIAFRYYKRMNAQTKNANSRVASQLKIANFDFF